MDEAVDWAIRATGPGIACLVVGIALNMWKTIRYRRTSRWGIRLTMLGVSLTGLGTGVLILIATIGGTLHWPMAVAGIAEITVGIGFLANVRHHWAARASDSN